MPDYSKAKIYRIRSVENDDVYIGSTLSTLSVRFSNHKSHFKAGTPYCSSWEVLKHASAYIELIELFPCDTRKQLHERERHFILEIDCVNKNIPLRTDKEYREVNRDAIKIQRTAYYLEHAEELRAEGRTYYDDHVEDVRAYYQANKDKFAERQREYRKKNAEMVLQKQREYRARRKQIISQH
jgi:hypothetical protein